MFKRSKSFLMIVLFAGLVSACDHDGTPRYVVTASAGEGGSITPASTFVSSGGEISLTVTPDADDFFGRSLAISRDGSTLAVGANHEDSAGQGIEPAMQNDNSASASGAVYVFVRDATDTWSQQAYIKASNAETADYFGSAPNSWDNEIGGTLALSADGNILAVGALREASTAIGINGDQTDNGRLVTGAAYVFTRSGGTSWSQQAYIKPSNAGGGFGMHLDMSDDGSTLAVGAAAESSNATGVGGDATDTSAYLAGAVYLY